MNPIVEKTLELAGRARDLHEVEREITRESVLLVGELMRTKAALRLRMKYSEFADFIGLTPNQLWKRSQIARTIRFFPEVLDMFDMGEIRFSHVAVVAGKLTQANSRELLAWMRFKSKREVEAMLPAIGRRGIDWSVATTLSPFLFPPPSPGKITCTPSIFPGEESGVVEVLPRGR